MARAENYVDSVLTERWDTDAGTYTRYNSDGTVAESRALTTQEVAALTPQPQPPTAEERLAAAAAALAALDTIAAPVLTADVLDVLVDVRNALEA